MSEKNEDMLIPFNDIKDKYNTNIDNKIKKLTDERSKLYKDR